jgi:hypothetical protein
VPLLDRKMEEISPIEHAVMWIGAYEFQHCLDVPWRVVLNECIELAKEFGGTDGHKYVNACSTAWRPGCAPPKWRPTASTAGKPADRKPAHADLGTRPAHRPFYVMEVAKAAAASGRQEVAAAASPWSI